MFEQFETYQQRSHSSAQHMRVKADAVFSGHKLWRAQLRYLTEKASRARGFDVQVISSFIPLQRNTKMCFLKKYRQLYKAIAE